MSDSKKNSFYISGIILALASVISRLIGLFFRIPLTRILGDTGYGAYSNAYAIYNLALLLSTFGMPTAISRLVSKRETLKEYKSSYKIFKIGLLLSSVLGLIMSLIVWFFAEEIALFLTKSSQSAIPLKALAPTIFVFSLLGVFRGFFQGKNTMIPTSVSQILEQIVHVIAGLIFAKLFINIYEDNINKYAYGACGATLGTLMGAFFALIFLLCIYFMYKPYLKQRTLKDKHTAESTKAVLFSIVFTVLPIILNQVLYSLTGNLDQFIYNNILNQKGVGEEVRLVSFGRYNGKFIVLTNIPLAIASAIGVAIIPNITRAFEKKDKESLYSNIYKAVKFNMMIAIPCTLGLMVLAGPIMSVLFGDISEMSERLMLIGGISIIFYAYSTTTNNILQGMGKFRFPVIHAVVGIIIYAFTDVMLLMFTNLNIYVLAIGYTVFPLTIGILNFFTIKHETRYRQEILKTFILPFIFSVYMAAGAFFSYKGLYKLFKNEIVALFLAIMVGIIVYVIFMLFTNTITKEELQELPFGTKIIKIFKKTGFLNERKFE